METQEKRPRLVIVMEGGLIQTILSDNQDLDVTVLDYDTEGAEPGDVICTPDPLPYDQNHVQSAYWRKTAPEPIEDYEGSVLMGLVAAADKRVEGSPYGSPGDE